VSAGVPYHPVGEDEAARDIVGGAESKQSSWAAFRIVTKAPKSGAKISIIPEMTFVGAALAADWPIGVGPLASKRKKASWASVFVLTAIGILVLLGLLSLAL
jgi:hypothetical protein